MNRKVIFFLLIIMITSQSFSDENDEARELLLAERDGDILFLSKINFGFPEGDNWIVDRNDGYTYIYTINNDKEVKEVYGMYTFEQAEIQYWDQNTRSYVALEYDIIQDIPGTRIGNKAAKFGDYDGDGKDDIFNMFISNDLLCSIRRYDSDKEKDVSFFYCTFSIVSPKEPVPVIFVNYQGTNGILAFQYVWETEQSFWSFYKWNEESREYKLMESILADEIDWSEFTVVKNENSQIDSGFAVPGNESEFHEKKDALEETSAFAPADSGKNTRSNLYIVIIAAVALAVAVFIVVRKRGKI